MSSDQTAVLRASPGPMNGNDRELAQVAQEHLLLLAALFVVHERGRTIVNSPWRLLTKRCTSFDSA